MHNVFIVTYFYQFYICVADLNMCILFTVTCLCMYYISSAELQMCKLFSITYLCLFYICAVELYMCKLFSSHFFVCYTYVQLIYTYVNYSMHNYIYLIILISSNNIFSLWTCVNFIIQ
ncbi:hypothetical protein Hanom_Chr15g01359621 [Helianthus anomalus]